MGCWRVELSFKSVQFLWKGRTGLWSAREVNIYNPGIIIPIMSPWAWSRSSVEILSGRNLFVPVQQLFTYEFWELLWEWWWCTTSRALELCIHHDHLFWLLGVSRICCPLVINPSSLRSVRGQSYRETNQSWEQLDDQHIHVKKLPRCT
jgi:hypothetical protein